MLLERGKASKDVGGRTRRCFVSPEFELYFFFEPDGSLFGFQLLFPQGGLVQMLSWTPVEQFRYFVVSDVSGGSQYWDYDRHTMPADIAALDTDELHWRLGPESSGLEPALRGFLLDKISGAREALRYCRYCSACRTARWRCDVCHSQACEECLGAKSLRGVPCAGSLEPRPAPHRWAQL